MLAGSTQYRGPTIYHLSANRGVPPTAGRFIPPTPMTAQTIRTTAPYINSAAMSTGFSATPGATGQAAAGGGGSSNITWDPNSDPIIAQIRGQANQMTQLAKSNLLRLQKQELIGFGSQSLAKSILGNDPILKTISGNPDKSFSFLANLKRQYGVPIGSKENWLGAARVGLIPQAEEGLNQDNLWFSSTHGDTLRTLEQNKLQEQDMEQRRVQALLGNYQNDYLNAVLQAKSLIQQAILARQNALGII